MSDCCTNNTDSKEEETEVNNEPKSFIGKYLYKMGKKDFDKEKESGKVNKGCC